MNQTLRQGVNPYLPCYEYIPDAEPHIIGDRVYIYGSHDIFNSATFCMGDYLCYSAPVEDLGAWRYEGVILRRDQDPGAKASRLFNGMAAPDLLIGPDGKYYLYYFIGGTGKISVAVCDTPAGQFEFYGYVHYADGVPIGKKNDPLMFDPGIFLDDDGRLYLYVGFGLDSNPLLLKDGKPSLYGPLCYELDPADMLTVKNGPRYIGVAGKKNERGSGYEGHAFLEASSMRKFEDRYYFIYSSLQSHELCYAVSRYPDRGFCYGGVLISNGDIGLPGVTDVRLAHNDTGNTHGSLIRIKDRYYVFYHRQTNRKQSCRQACAEEITFRHGKFLQAEMTSNGLNGGPLAGKGKYPAYLCCNLYGRRGTRFLSMIKRASADVPYLTQSGRDYSPQSAQEDHLQNARGNDRQSARDHKAKSTRGGMDHVRGFWRRYNRLADHVQDLLYASTDVKPPIQYIANFCDGAVAGFKYFDLTETTRILMTVHAAANGIVSVRMSEFGPVIAQIRIRPTGKGCATFGTTLRKKAQIMMRKWNNTGNAPLYFSYHGAGQFDFIAFTLA